MTTVQGNGPQIYGHGNDNDQLKLTAHFGF